MLCAGSSVAVIVLARLLQGLSAAVVWSAALALLVDTVGRQRIGQAMGYVSVAITCAMLLAPVLGGVVYDRSGYYAVFAMAFSLLGLDIFFRIVMIEKKAAVRWLAHDDPGAQEGEGQSVARRQQQPQQQQSTALDPEKQHTATEAAGRAGLNGYPLPAAAPELPPAAAAPAVGGTLEPSAESLSPSSPSAQGRHLPPLLTLLKSRRMLTALWCTLVQATLLTSFESVLPLFVSRTFGWTSTGAGLIFLAIVLPSFLSPIIGWLSDKYGARAFTTLGFLLAVVPLALLRLVERNALGHKVLLAVLLALTGACLTLVMTPVMAEVGYLVAAKERRHAGLFGARGAYAQAYGLFNTAFAGGTLVGPLWGGFIEEHAGWKTLAWTLALLSGASAVPAVVFTGGYLFARRSASSSNPCTTTATTAASTPTAIDSGPASTPTSATATATATAATTNASTTPATNTPTNF